MICVNKSPRADCRPARDRGAGRAAAGGEILPRAGHGPPRRLRLGARAARPREPCTVRLYTAAYTERGRERPATGTANRRAPAAAGPRHDPAAAPIYAMSNEVCIRNGSK